MRSWCGRCGSARLGRLPARGPPGICRSCARLPAHSSHAPVSLVQEAAPPPALFFVAVPACAVAQARHCVLLLCKVLAERCPPSRPTPPPVSAPRVRASLSRSARREARVCPLPFCPVDRCHLPAQSPGRSGPGRQDLLRKSVCCDLSYIFSVRQNPKQFNNCDFSERSKSS